MASLSKSCSEINTKHIKLDHIEYKQMLRSRQNYDKLKQNHYALNEKYMQLYQNNNKLKHIHSQLDVKHQCLEHDYKDMYDKTCRLYIKYDQTLLLNKVYKCLVIILLILIFMFY